MGRGDSQPGGGERPAGSPAWQVGTIVGTGTGLNGLTSCTDRTYQWKGHEVWDLIIIAIHS